MGEQKSQEKREGEGVIRGFRAAVVVVLGCLLGYFVYATTLNTDSKYPFKFGLDLAGGSQLTYVADVSKIEPSDVPELMSVLREVIERRVNAFGVSEPNVQVERGSAVAEGASVQRLIVELPGVTNIDDAIKQIGQTPLLEFKLVDQEALAAEQSAQNAAGTGTVVSNVRVNGEVIEPYVDTGPYRSLPRAC
jgi:preprotein translocase subunit SecD